MSNKSKSNLNNKTKRNNKLIKNLEFCKKIKDAYYIKHEEVKKLGEIINKSKKNFDKKYKKSSLKYKKDKIKYLDLHLKYSKCKKEYDAIELKNLQLDQDINLCHRQLEGKKRIIDDINEKIDEMAKIIVKLPKKHKDKFKQYVR